MSKDLVIEIRLDGGKKATADAKEINAAVTQLTDAVKKSSASTSAASNSFSGLGRTFAGVGLGSAAVAAAIVATGRAMIDAQVSAQKLQATLAYVAGGSAGAARELEYLRSTTNRLGLDFTSASKAYASFAAATKESGISSETTRQTFEGVAKAASHLGLSADETGGALLALSQMASKGTVSAEELRGQLGERLPGAFAIAARAMGVTQAELGKLLETGQIATSDFLPRFAAALNESFGHPVDNAVSAINRLSSAWDLWKQDLFSGSGARGLSVISDALNESSAAMRRLGNEAGVTHRALVALGGALAGAAGASHFDVAGRQRKMLQSTLPGLRQQINELEDKKAGSVFGALNLIDAGKLADLQNQYRAAVREMNTELAVSAGKIAGFKDPDLKGQFEAQRAKAGEKLGAYLGDTGNESKAVKLSAALETENKAFRAATAGFTFNSKEYASALEAHERRVAEINAKGASKTGGGRARAGAVIDLEEFRAASLRDIGRQAKDELRALESQDRAISAMEKTTGNLANTYQRQNAIYNEKQMTGPERAQAETLRKVEEAADAAREALSQKAATLEVDNVVALDAYRAAVLKVSEAEGVQVEKIKTLQAEQDRLNSLWETGAARALTKWSDASVSVADQVEQAFTRGFQGMEDALMTFINTGKLNFADLAKSILADLTRIEIRAQMTRLLGGGRSLLSGIGGATMAGAGTASENWIDSGGLGAGAAGGVLASAAKWLGGLFPSAHGNVFSSSGLSALSGSVVSRPTLFPFAHGIGLAGEAGPEAILPLARDASGNLGVRGGGGHSIVIHQHFNGNTSANEVRRSSGALARDVLGAISGSGRYR
ncbi:MAG: tape measure protein [Candidatus Accumulibacter propinquus]|uniref:tape measure protein n=1 Tax=Candidatus Accumulibacter propinquus TaxID=2954380 RepID=UPI002FC2B28A